MSTTNKRVVIPSPRGGYSIVQDPIPKPSKGQLLVRVQSAGLNPLDWKQHDWELFVTSYPYPVGGEISGIVESIGEGIDRFKVGDKIFTQANGGYGQFVIVNENTTYSLPENLSFNDGATVSSNLITTIIGLFDKDPIGLGLNPSFETQPWPVYKEQSALIIGGNGSIGQFSIQLLRLMGFKDVVAYASKIYEDRLIGLGAHRVIDRETVSLSKLKENKDFKLFDIVIDTAGTPETQNGAIENVKIGGGILNPSVLVHPGIEDRLKEENKKIFNLTDTSSPKIRELSRDLIPELLKHNILKPPPYEVLGGLESVGEGVDRLRKRQAGGRRLLIHPFD